MKKPYFSLVILFIFSLTAFAQNAQQIEYLKSFARTYGYVKYFHPSDEAQTIDWDAFATYGTQQVLNCSTNEQLEQTLYELFAPVTPNLELVKESTLAMDNFSQTDPGNCKFAYWQHLGLGLGATSGGNVYKSVRVNAMNTQEQSSAFANLSTSIDLSDYLNTEIRLQAKVRVEKGSKGDARLWFRVDNSDDSFGFFDNMGDRPIKDSAWKTYEIVGKITDIGSRLIFGGLVIGKATAYYDNFTLSYRKSAEGPWIPIDLYNASFEEAKLDKKEDNALNRWSGRGDGYNFDLVTSDVTDGLQAVKVTHEGESKQSKGRSLFGSAPERGATIQESIGNGLFVSVPLTLCVEDNATRPKTDATELKSLQSAVDSVNPDPLQLATKLGNVIIAYNVFQHFYPYMDVLEMDWDQQLSIALEQSFADKTPTDHLKTLRQLTHPLKDGHIRVSHSGTKESHMPGFTWEVIQKKLLINQVIDNNLALKVGDEVTHINGISAQEFLQDVYSTISAGNQGWMDHRAKTQSLIGLENSELKLKVGGKEIRVKRDRPINENWEYIYPERISHKPIGESIYYVNLDNTKMDSIDTLMPKLEQAKGLIFDLRGYPDGNHGLISHLLKEKDTVANWMRIPNLIQPDQKGDIVFNQSGWQMPTKKPYLGDKKVVFLIDGSAISYAESYMGFIDGYNLATIVGQPTAGANGNVNRFILPGGYSISFTGMKVLKHNGSQHHTIGVLPDVYVEKTATSLQEGRDEFLEKAIEIIEKQ